MVYWDNDMTGRVFQKHSMDLKYSTDLNVLEYGWVLHYAVVV